VLGWLHIFFHGVGDGLREALVTGLPDANGDAMDSV